MSVELGLGALAISWAVNFYGVLAAILAARRHSKVWLQSARLAMLLAFPLLSLSAFALVYLLVNARHEVVYVFQVTSKDMPTLMRVAAWWGGQAGSLLFWSWLLAAFASVSVLFWRERDEQLLPWVILVCQVTLAFFVGMVLLVENPFARFWMSSSGQSLTALFQPAGAKLLIPPDGAGLNPLLRHTGMLIHPPMLYLGFTGFVVPFAFAVAALVTGSRDEHWLRDTRRWTLLAWLFLSLGLVLGSRWAYDVLGWGGYWGWDPVEIAALLPWLSGTAFLHSAVIQQKRGLFRRWNVILALLTYALVLFGTFLTRSGVLSSVHAFAESGTGLYFLVFIAFTFSIMLGLILYRWQEMRSDARIGSLLARESLFLANNLLFMSILAICLWGMLYPLVSELLTGQKVTVGPPFYERATGPLFGGLLLLMGVAPLSAWGHATLRTLGRAIWIPGVISLAFSVGLWWRGLRSAAGLFALWLCFLAASVIILDVIRAVNARSRRTAEPALAAMVSLVRRYRRRYGGYLVHLGVVCMGVGIIGIEVFQSQTQGSLQPGESLTLAGYQVTYRSLDQFETPGERSVSRAVVDVSRDGQPLGQVYPRRDYYNNPGQSMTIPGVRSTLRDDLYILLVDWQPITRRGATFRIYHNPLINWLWLGAVVFILGTLVAAWPENEHTLAARRQAAEDNDKRQD